MVKEAGTVELQARSASRRIWRPLQQGATSGRVLAAFDRACILATTGGTVAALVAPQIGDGPLNIVLDCGEGVFDRITPGVPVRATRSGLQVGDLSVPLDEARIWEPRPDWERLRPLHRSIAQQVPLLLSTAVSDDHWGSLLSLVSKPASGSGSPRANSGSGRCGSERDPEGKGQHDLDCAIVTAALLGARALGAGWNGDHVALHEGVTQLAGLGNGLTPAGDDFLAGFMLWAWLAYSTPRPLCHEIAELAAPRTTALSAAFLRAAADGECSTAWHELLGSLPSDPDRISSAVGKVLSHGQTSGADTLAGFLWMASKTFSADSGSSLKRIPRAL